MKQIPLELGTFIYITIYLMSKVIIGLLQRDILIKLDENMLYQSFSYSYFSYYSYSFKDKIQHMCK